MTKKTYWTWFISIWQIYMMIQMEWIQYKSFFVIFFSFLGKKQPLNLLFMKRCRMDWVMRWYNRPPPALGLRFPKIWSPWQIWCQQLVQFLKISEHIFWEGGSIDPCRFLGHTSKIYLLHLERGSVFFIFFLNRVVEYEE